MSSLFPLLNSKLKREATYVPSRSMRTTSKVQSEHTQSLCYMSIRKFFTCLNHIPPIKFYFAKLYLAPSRFISSETTCMHLIPYSNRIDRVCWRYREFQFPFRSKFTWSYIFHATNCRRIIKER